MPKGQRILHLLQDCITALLAPPPTTKEQRENDKIVCKVGQRVIDDSPIITIPRITDAPGIIEARNLTAKRKLKEMPCAYRRVTRNNTLGIVASPVAPTPYVPIPSGAQQPIVTRHAINLLMTNKCVVCNLARTPTALLPSVVKWEPPHFEHFACPMVHPVTGKTISSYKKLMHDPATAETWQTAFGKEFGGMIQSDNKIGQKGTNAMFVMSHNEIKHMLSEGKKFTYGNPVIDYCPHKDDPHRICITAGGGNLINYKSSPSVHMADLDTAKLHWNSVISTKAAKYMCLDIKNFYLTAKLEYFEYMRMPLDLLPIWIKSVQYETARVQRIRPSRNATGSVGLTTGWQPCQQMFTTELSPICFFQKSQHPSAMVPRIIADLIHTCRQ
jgi:hypothetical protein